MSPAFSPSLLPLTTFSAAATRQAVTLAQQRMGPPVTCDPAAAEAGMFKMHVLEAQPHSGTERSQCFLMARDKDSTAGK